MRKLKLLIAACALLGAGQTWAQTDVTSTYLTNADFSSGTPIDNNVCTYGKDMANNGTTYYGAQAIDGWTNASEGAEDSGNANSKLAGALFAYGSTPWLAGSGTVAPATDPNGNAGNAAGLCAVWAGKVQYTQDVTLPAGSYTVRFQVYNATSGSGNSSGVITTDLFGFVEDGGTAHYAPNNTFAIGQWSTVAVTFQLSAETAGKISMGYVGPSGNAAMPHLFVDNVKILSNEMYTDCTSKVNSTGWTGASDGYQGSTINTARQYGDKSVGRHIYQTVSGLENGTYEVALYSISQKEWNGSLASDAGNVAYVFAAEGAYELKEWINARARATYPGDENLGIYTLSGVKVTGGTLTLGMGLAQADLTEWHHVQIKSLIRTNAPDLTDFANALALAVSNAEALNGLIPTAAYNAIQAVVAEKNKTYTTGDDYQAATTAINTAIGTYGSATMQANYAEYKTFVQAINALKAVAVTADTESAKTTNTSTLETAMSDIDAAVEAVTDDASTITTQIQAMKAAGKAYITGLVPADPDNAPFDMTFLIVNPTFVNNNTTGWSGDTNKVGFGQKCGNAEFYQQEFDIYQTLTDMPKATYQLKVKAFNRPGWASAVIPAYVNAEDKKNGTYGTHSVIYVNSGEQAIYNAASAMNTTAKGGSESSATVNEVTYYIPNDMNAANTYFNAGNYDNSVTVLCTTGSIKFGFKSVETHVDGDWTIFDDFRLYMTGALDLSAFKDDLSAAVTAANAIAEGTIPSAVYTSLQNTIATYNKDYETADEYSTAINAINAAKDAASLLVTPYADWKKIKAFADALVAVTNDNDEANGTLRTAINDNNTSVEAATAEGTITTATATLKTAMTTYVNTANPVGDGAQFDCTFMLTNPDVSGFANGDKPAGWYCDYSGTAWHNPSVNRNAVSLDGTKNATYEFWTENAVATNEFTVYQKVALPEGTFTMSCLAFADANGVEGATNNQVYFFANDTQGSKIVSQPNKLAEASISFVNSSEQEVKIGLKALTGNQYRWMGIGYVELYKVPAKTYTVDEAAAWDNTTAGAGEVTLNRNIKAGVNTLVLPFSMTQAEVESYFGAGSKVYEVKSYDAAAANISFGVKEGISANEPCLLKATATGTTYTLEGRTIVAGEPVMAGTNVTMTGTYAATMYAPTDSYIVSGDKLYKVDSNVTLKNTRAYVTVTEPTSARVLTMSFGDDATGIATIENGELKVETGVIYDLSGRKVTAPAKGIYVINGKKIVK